MKKLYKVKKSNIDKNGLYAAKDIKAGTRIIEYVGKIISKKKLREMINLIMEKIFIFLISIINLILMVILNGTLLDWSITLVILIVKLKVKV